MKLSCLPVSLFGDICSGKMTLSEWACTAKKIGYDGIDISIMFLKNRTPTYLKSLKEVAEFEGYTETAKSEFEALEKKLQHDPEHDLNYFKKDITDYINYEIVKRYYFQKGGLMQQLKHDEEIDEAAGIINDRARYAQLLSPAKEEAAATDRAKSMENE